MILSVDYGERYVGLAATDADEKMAVRHSTIDQTKEDAIQKISDLVMREEASLVLVGVPISLSGKASAQTQVSLDFVDRLRRKIGPEIEVQPADETLTSVEAGRRVKAEGGRPEESHMEAARIILEDYLRAKSSSIEV